jgi:hypothetical protein
MHSRIARTSGRFLSSVSQKKTGYLHGVCSGKIPLSSSFNVSTRFEPVSSRHCRTALVPHAAFRRAQATAHRHRSLVLFSVILAVLLSPCVALADETLSPDLVKTLEEWLVRKSTTAQNSAKMLPYIFSPYLSKIFKWCSFLRDTVHVQAVSPDSTKAERFLSIFHCLKRFYGCSGRVIAIQL